MFKGRQFDQSVILLCVRWYLAYNLSLRDLEEMMAERGIAVDHTTIHRWTVRYAPLLLERFNRRKRSVTGRWHIDETYIKIRGQWMHLYRAIDVALVTRSNSGSVSNVTCRRPSGSSETRWHAMADRTALSSTVVKPTMRLSFPYHAQATGEIRLQSESIPGRAVRNSCVSGVLRPRP